MKIKTVCAAAELTERTVRYYIEENLIAPDYTENCLGRKTFDFCENDICQLHHIVVLRKSGFSVAEIRQMIRNPQHIAGILQQLQFRKSTLTDEGRPLLRLDPGRAYTAAALAELLSEAAADLNLPAEDTQWSMAEIASGILKAALIATAVWMPVVMACIGLVDSIRRYHYPVIDPLGIVLTAVSLLPAILLLLLPKLGEPGKRKEMARRILVVLCVLSIPFCWLMPGVINSCSRTTDFRNYRDLDPECLGNRSMLFQELFPKWPHYFENVQQPDGSWETVYLDAHYYYMYSNSWDYTYDIIAEWPLPEEEFHAEVERAKAVFEKRDHTVMEKGDYTCLIVYSGSPPFEKAATSYTYCIFAYDEENLRVRYIYCDSLDDGADQPYYLQMEW